ncbi:hypothetical protein UXO14_13995 [Enterobacter hormaechei]|uniref:hypothetical protein n=1 Tax=Citrobacter freundii TaxID=546 RepID=UPI000D12385F|nr:hypothetical protein [Citrobacter freundii]MCM7491576.1 hypothetical protein [Enterobacter hormaechei]PSM61059.1 hypothetical protein C3K52_19330 [Citrobacter freundii]
MVQFSELTKMTQDIWSFVWPPLAICIIAYFVAHYFHPVGTKNVLRNAVASAKAYGIKLERTRAILEPYGLTKLVPVISVIVLASFMFILNGPISNLVENIPPYISYQPDLLISKTMSEDQQLVLIRKYPMTHGLNEAYYLASENTELENKIEFKYDRVTFWYQAHLLLKFAFVFSVIMLVISLKNGLSKGKQFAKFFLMSVFLSVLWIICLTSLLYQQEQEIYDESRRVILFLNKDATAILAYPINDEERKKLSPTWNQREERWWKIYFFDSDRLKWIQRTLYPYDSSKRR